MIRLELKNCNALRLELKKYNTILTEKLQKYHHYYMENLINIIILQVKKNYLLIENK